jgi:hypothetical protein
MRTPLDIDEDVFRAAADIAREGKKTARSLAVKGAEPRRIVVLE